MAFDAFLELLEGDAAAVSGETLDKKFENQEAMQLLSFDLKSNQDLYHERLSTPGAEEEPMFYFTVTKDIDNATPDLFRAYCQYWATRQHGLFERARVTLRKAAAGKQMKYLVLEFEDVYIKKWSLENKDGDSLPEEELDFCFATCHILYKPQVKSGGHESAITGGWNLAAHGPLE